MSLLKTFNPVAGLATAFLSYKQKKEDTKVATATLANAASLSKDKKEHTVTMTTAQWEMASKKQENNTWKDEYVTIVVTTPLVALILGALTTPDLSLFVAAQLVIDKINTIDMNTGYGRLLLVVILAAVGIKVFKR